MTTDPRGPLALSWCELDLVVAKRELSRQELIYRQSLGLVAEAITAREDYRGDGGDDDSAWVDLLKEVDWTRECEVFEDFELRDAEQYVAFCQRLVDWWWAEHDYYTDLEYRLSA